MLTGSEFFNAQREGNLLNFLMCVGGTRIEMGQKKEDIHMLIEMGCVALAMFSVKLVAVLFFCSIELAPDIIRRQARVTRYSGLEKTPKRVRFW